MNIISSIKDLTVGAIAPDSIVNADCLEAMKLIADNSIDLICTDPPYFKVKKDSWDRQWDKPKEFLSWLDSIAEQWQRILKPNGSLYCFASPRMSAQVEVMLMERFNVLTNIKWVKEAGWHKRAAKEEARQFQTPSESIIFCEHYPAKSKGIGGILRQQRKASSFSTNELAKFFPSLSGGITGAVRNWELGNSTPSKDQWDKLSSEINLPNYEDICRPFSVTAEVPYTDVWTYLTVNYYHGKHPCEKPIAMLEHIINASSREGALILDSFGGSANTAKAAINTNRRYICIEKDPHYFQVSCDRVANHDPNAPVKTKKPKAVPKGQLALF